MRNEDQERALTEVERRVVETVLTRATHRIGPPLDEVLAESIYLEGRRLHDDPNGDDVAFWDSIRGRLWRANDRTQRELLAEVVAHYAREIVGNFDPRVYRAVTRAGPHALGLLLNAVSPKRILSHFPRLPSIDEAMVIQGQPEHLRRLHELGTVLLVPTHVSNLDSIIVGFALYRMGLPPFVYGAGLNLFSNPMIGYFMHNLGAYTVDRKKSDPLYKEVLKTYATVSLEIGDDNIFFPGGTRSRSGAVESKLKLGLLGCGLAAYIENLRRRVPKPRTFIVPMTLSYQLTLEAETLIDDFLKEVGKSRYIITDDEFSEPRRVFDFIASLLNLESKIYVTVCRGYDPFGNTLDDDGESLDPCGRRIDPSRYVLAEGEPRQLAARDGEYTRELGEKIAESFSRNNVIMSTHVTARAVFGQLRRSNRKVPLLRVIRGGGQHQEFEHLETCEVVARLLGDLRALALSKNVLLDPVVSSGTAEDVIADGLRHFAIYHHTPAITRKGDRLFATDRNLLFYYQNRLEGYGLYPEPELRPALSPDHRSLGANA
ncbi:MAG: 1-acyl-sn-glycerol-3-phosphate acyltransferase [Deltaproteobacteria bacterium]|nr:1-acyl-sn-glycerol-3-phosphate acyltransferase [Deltaproteobacteria bacterium]